MKNFYFQAFVSYLSVKKNNPDDQNVFRKHSLKKYSILKFNGMDNVDPSKWTTESRLHMERQDNRAVVMSNVTVQVKDYPFSLVEVTVLFHVPNTNLVRINYSLWEIFETYIFRGWKFLVLGLRRRLGIRSRSPWRSEKKEVRQTGEELQHRQSALEAVLHRSR